MYLVSNTQLQSIEELATFHIAVYVIAVDAQALAKYRKHGNDRLERGQTTVERSITATTRYGKTAREDPVAILISSLKARNERSGSLTLEQLGVATAILHAISKGSKSRSYLTCLVSTLHIERQM